MNFLAYVFAGLLVIALLAFGEQEISLRAQLSTVNRSLDTEIQCRVGSTCAQKLDDESARGTALVEQARQTADAESKAQKAALDQQAMDALRQQQQATAEAQKQVVAWQQKYNAALKSPPCAQWAQQAVACAVP